MPRIAIPDEHGTLYDAHTGVEIDALPRAARDSGSTTYVIGHTPWAQIVNRYANAGDTVGGPPGGSIRSFTYRTKGKPARIAAATSWGVDPDADPATQIATLERVLSAWEALGEEPRASGSSAASAWIAEYLAPKGAKGPPMLPPAYRWAWRAAGYTGPALALRSGLPAGGVGVELDRKAAYLAEMRAPLPTLDSYSHYPAYQFDALRAYCERTDRDAIVTVRATIAPGDWGLPAGLPVRTARGAIHWGGGARVVGAYPIGWLSRCIDAGAVEVHDLLDNVTFRRAPYLAPLADRIEAVPDSTLRKVLYTRGVAMAGFVPWPTARVVENTDRRAILSEWSRPVPWWSNKVPPWHRPDVSGAIWVSNAEKVTMEIYRHLAAGTPVCAAHVDAVWCGAAEPAPGWVAKARGPLRVYGVGSYDVGEKRGRMSGEFSRRLPLPAKLLCDGAGEWDRDPVVFPDALYRPRPTPDTECPDWYSSQDSIFSRGWLADKSSGAEPTPRAAVFDGRLPAAEVSAEVA